MGSSDSFKPALVVVDMQEDFCPPNGSLAVQEGRDIAPGINSLLDLPFTLTVATKDFHPADHVSFASNHPPPNNKPFESIVTIKNPYNPEETQQSRLWPDHCIQGTLGADIIPEINVSKIQHIVEKGCDNRVEMYSAFKDPFENPTVSESKLKEILKSAGITHVYCVGLATDYCVNYTAMDSAKEGFKTYVVEDVVRAVDPSSLSTVKKEHAKYDVDYIKIDGPEIEKVKKLA